jgi:hypothetical protein
MKQKLHLLMILKTLTFQGLCPGTVTHRLLSPEP